MDKQKKNHGLSTGFYSLTPSGVALWVQINPNRVSLPSGTVDHVVFREGRRLWQDETQWHKDAGRRQRTWSTEQRDGPSHTHWSLFQADTHCPGWKGLWWNVDSRPSSQRKGLWPQPSIPPAPHQQRELGEAALAQRADPSSLLTVLENVLGALGSFFIFHSKVTFKPYLVPILTGTLYLYNTLSKVSYLSEYSRERSFKGPLRTVTLTILRQIF